MYVYVIRNSATGKVYIGQHKGTNLKKYLQMKLSQAEYELRRKGHGRGSHLFNSMRKHPKDVWSIEPLMEVDTKEELDRLETLLIAFYDTRNPQVGYNICKGGEGFTGTHTDEWRRNHSAKMKGRVYSPETIAKMKAAPKSEVQLNNLKRARDPDVAAKRAEGCSTPSCRVKLSEAGKRQWECGPTPVQLEQLTTARTNRWEKYRREDTLTTQIVVLRKQGLTQRAIALQLGVGKSTVNSHLQKFMEENSSQNPL
jgi:hypothetical protein